MPGTELVTFDKYEVASVDPEALISAIRANLGGQQLSHFDLDTIKMPSGGQLAWMVPTLEGGEEPKRELEGVIVLHKLVRSYWKRSLDEQGGGNPPDCSSPDSEWGYGDPGDQLRADGKRCEECPNAQFGSDPRDDSQAQACKQSHLLFLIRPDEMLPCVVRLAPTSLGGGRKFLLRLASRAVPYWKVVVKIGLEKARSAGGQDYAKATFAVGQTLEDEQAAKVKALSDTFEPIFARAAREAAASGAGGGADAEADGKASKVDGKADAEPQDAF